MMVAGNQNPDEEIMMIVSKCKYAPKLETIHILHACRHIFGEIYKPIISSIENIKPIVIGTKQMVPYNLIHACIKEQYDMVWDI